MSNPAARRRDPPARVIGEFVGDVPGPLLLIIAAIHGNEIAGIAAAREVLADLGRTRGPLRGRVLALTGNRGAVAEGTRFLERDLNRLWGLEGEGRHGSSAGLEEAERTELKEALDGALGGAAGNAVILDLHSTSATSPPFTIISDTLRSRRVAFAIPVPVLLGLEEAVTGTLIEYLAERRLPVVAIEGGQHDAPATIRHHVAAIWSVLAATGMLDPETVPNLRDQHALLRRATSGLPGVVEVIHRHALEEGDGFRMREGLASFRTVRRGELLARDREGEIRAASDGFLLLPHYQAQGDDGFFLGKRVRRFWLDLSALLRRWRLEVLLPLLPGVRRHPAHPDTLIADPRVARWQTVHLFHLFGFRRRHSAGGDLLFSRRPEGPRDG